MSDHLCGRWFPTWVYRYRNHADRVGPTDGIEEALGPEMGGRGLCPVSHRNQTGPLVWSGYDANTAPLDTASIETKKSEQVCVGLLESWWSWGESNPRPQDCQKPRRVRNDANLHLLRCEGVQGAALGCTCDGSRLYPAPVSKDLVAASGVGWPMGGWGVPFSSTTTEEARGPLHRCTCFKG